MPLHKKVHDNKTLCKKTLHLWTKMVRNSFANGAMKNLEFNSPCQRYPLAKFTLTKLGQKFGHQKFIRKTEYIKLKVGQDSYEIHILGQNMGKLKKLYSHDSTQISESLNALKVYSCKDVESSRIPRTDDQKP